MTLASMAYAFPPLVCPTQNRSVRYQLDRGICAVGFEVHESAVPGAAAGAFGLCIGDCTNGELQSTKPFVLGCWH
jgi:hypothetical protein